MGASGAEPEFLLRGLYSDVGPAKQDGHLGAGPGAELWASACEKRILFHVESVSS